ncbi:MAG: FAD-dependent oxidoreductase [Gammaproteobacteria bacterium]|nr:FAD-dependent oxidoreductase [Gammaproteobacteria bacterium]MDH3468095.1 FAD-dependent oxidoreductase [Gammaproteobacteria bacterium]
MTTHTRVCIVGGGAMGVGLFYHLALEGWTDIILVEKGELTSGSTWHAAGLCPHFIASLTMAKIHVYGAELYPKLEELTGQPAGWHGCGSLRLALTDEEVNWFHYVQGIGKLVGFELDVIGPSEIKQIHPFLEVGDVKAGALTFTDGHVDPSSMTNAMAKGGRDLGAKLQLRNRVLDIKPAPDGEWEVVTEKGSIVCEHVVNAAGSYCDIVGGWTGHTVPITNMLHHYVVTEPVEEFKQLDKELPVVRDPYCSSYIRQEQNGILVGPYETEGSKSCLEDIRWDFESELLPAELDRLEPWLLKACERIPLFGEYGIRRTVAGAITHTPDGNFLAGPAPGRPNYWMCCGAAIGISQGAGAGKYLAEWMVHGQSEINMAEVDPRRYGDWSAGDYCHARSLCEYEHMYKLLSPGEQHEAARPVRTSGLYDTLKAKGAQFADAFGWERVRWFDASGNGEDYSFRRTNWFDPVAEECKAVRERVGVLDLSSFAKYDITGADADAFLNRVTANGAPRKTGGVTLTHILTDAGMIEAEMTITRFADDRFYALSGATAEVKDFDLLNKGKQDGEAVEITNVTDDYGVLVVSGPESRNVLSGLTSADLTNASFRWLTGQEIEVGGVAARALRVSYAGELGWELHVPMGDLKALYDAVWTAGEPYGIKDFGVYAMNALRIEKGYRGMGAELTNEITMVEADMERFVNYDNDFIGRQATQNSKQQGARIQLVYMTVDADDAEARGNEPIFADGKSIGVSTSGGYGYTVGASIAFAYVDPAFTAPGTQLEIEILGKRRGCRVEAEPLWDPRNERLRV